MIGKIMTIKNKRLNLIAICTVMAMTLFQIAFGVECKKQVLFELPFGDGPNDVGASKITSEYQLPGKIRVDSKDNIYISDWSRSTIKKFSQNGQLEHTYKNLSSYGDFFVSENNGLYYQTGKTKDKQVTHIYKNGDVKIHAGFYVCSDINDTMIEAGEIPDYKYNKKYDLPHVTHGRNIKKISKMKHTLQIDVSEPVREYAKNVIGVKMKNVVNYDYATQKGGHEQIDLLGYDKKLNLYILIYTRLAHEGMIWQKVFVYNIRGDLLCGVNCPLDNYSNFDVNEYYFSVGNESCFYQLLNLNNKTQIVKWVIN
jgi:hypothetical protein